MTNNQNPTSLFIYSSFLQSTWHNQPEDLITWYAFALNNCFANILSLSFLLLDAANILLPKLLPGEAFSLQIYREIDV